MTGTVLDGLTPADVTAEPFPHIHATDRLPPADYAALVAALPSWGSIAPTVAGDPPPVIYLSSHAILKGGGIAPPLRDFVAAHLDGAFHRQVMALLGDMVRRLHPDLEARLGRSLEDVRVARRGERVEADLWLDCQLGFNPPSQRPFRVRGVHIDKRKRLYSALLYLRDPEDTAEGGDLALHRLKPGARLSSDVGAQDGDVERVKLLPYRANSLALFVNSDHSLHDVTPRGPAVRARRHLNFLAELDFDFV